MCPPPQTRHTPRPKHAHAAHARTHRFSPFPSSKISVSVREEMRERRASRSRCDEEAMAGCVPAAAELRSPDSIQAPPSESVVFQRRPSTQPLRGPFLCWRSSLDGLACLGGCCCSALLLRRLASPARTPDRSCGTEDRRRRRWAGRPVGVRGRVCIVVGAVRLEKTRTNRWSAPAPHACGAVCVYQPPASHRPTGGKKTRKKRRERAGELTASHIMVQTQSGAARDSGGRPRSIGRIRRPRTHSMWVGKGVVAAESPDSIHGRVD